LGNPIFKKFQV